jgi:DNA-binding SARP family transcriptional activator
MGADATPSLLITLAGAARVGRPGAAASRLERKTAALLAWLAFEGATPRARLAAMLWPGVDEARARANLRQCLARLRQGAGSAVEEAGGRLQLAAHVQLDNEGASTPELLDAERYDDLPEFEAWVEAQRSQRRATRRRALIGDVREALRSGELDRALAAADALLAADRESEEAYRTLMEVLYLRADHAAAIAVWDRCREMLMSLYGVAPSPATQHIGELVLQASRRSPAPLVRVDAVPATLLRPPRLVGRGAAWQVMQAACAAGDVVCVGGPSGIGKSRLLGDFAAVLGRHAAATARPGDALLPYATLSRLLLAAIDRFVALPALDSADLYGAARLLPRLATLIGGAPLPPVQTDHERTHALLAVARLLGRCVHEGCRVFVVDDLQFADAASAQALTVLAEPPPTAEDARTPLPFIFGARDEGCGEAVPRLLASLEATRRLVRIELTPLPVADISELLASLGMPLPDPAALAQRLHRHVGGHPAFVLETLKLLCTQQRLADGSAPLPLPQSVRDVIDTTLALLSEPARHIVQLAAAAGNDFTIELAVEALQVAPMQLAAPLQELAARRLFDGRAFSHDSVAEAVLQALPAALGAFLHRLVAEHLEGHGGEPAAAAGHWHAAGQPVRAGAAYREAAAAAAAASQPAAQCQLLDLAVASFETAGDDAALFNVLVERLAAHGAPDYAARRLELMDRLDALAGNERQRLQALQYRIGWHADQGRSDQVMAITRGAIDRALAAAEPRIAWNIAMAVSWQMALGGDVPAALAAIERHAAWLLAQPDRLLHGEYHFSLGGVHGWSDGLAAAVHHFGLAAAAFIDAGQPVRALPALANRGLMLHWRGEYKTARAVLGHAAELRDRLHGAGAAPVIDVNLGAALRDLGRHAEAVRLFEAALERFAAAAAAGDELGRTDAVAAENHLATSWLMLGQPERAAACLRTDPSGLAPHFVARRLAMQLRTVRCQRRRDVALRQLAQVQLAAGALLPHQRRLLALELTCTNDATTALAELDDALTDAALIERPGLVLHVALRRAERLHALGDAPAARQALQPWLEAPPGVEPYDLDPAEAWAIGHTVLGDGAFTTPLQARYRAWVHDTAAELPAAWLGPFERRLAALGLPPGA